MRNDAAQAGSAGHTDAPARRKDTTDLPHHFRGDDAGTGGRDPAARHQHLRHQCGRQAEPERKGHACHAGAKPRRLHAGPDAECTGPDRSLGLHRPGHPFHGEHGPSGSGCPEHRQRTEQRAACRHCTGTGQHPARTVRHRHFCGAEHRGPAPSGCGQRCAQHLSAGSGPGRPPFGGECRPADRARQRGGGQGAGHHHR